MNKVLYNSTSVLNVANKTIEIVVFFKRGSRGMEPNQIRALIEKLLSEVEEEDIGISLLSRQYQNELEMSFFNLEDQQKISQILKKLSQDSERHKQMLQDLVGFLGEKLNEPRIS